MAEWDLNAQRIIDLVERNLRGELTLEDVSRRLGYSPWYCTRQFSRVVGMSLRGYMRMRRLSEAAVELRDGGRGVLAIAVEFGFSSQEAFTRAFKEAWGVTPAAWRLNPIPLTLTTRRQALFPGRIGATMTKEQAKAAIAVSVQGVPARRFIGIREPGAKDYMDFWGRLAGRGVDCQAVEGALAGLTANAQIGGWYSRGGISGYVYGVEVPADYEGPVPEGMALEDIPASDYLVFHHPPYDFEADDEAVWEALREAVGERAEPPAGYAWRGDLPTWQRHDPEGMGQAWCRPVVKA